MRRNKQIPKSVNRARQTQFLPLFMHVCELVIALILVIGLQTIWNGIVRADPDVTPPSVPANLSLTGRSANSIDFSWDTSTDNVGVTGYRIFRNGSELTTTSNTSYSDVGLTPNTAYSYTVTAYDASANESAQSSALAVTTLADTLPPSVPGNVRQTNQTITSVTIAWNTSTDNVGVTGYDIYRNGLLVRTQAGTTFTDTGLAVYTTYIYTISAHDAANNASNLSTSLYATTAQDVTAPSVPDGITETGSTVSSVSLSWSASTDDVGVAGYRIYRSGTLVGTTAATNFTDTGLTVSNNYTYTIRAYDSATNTSAASAPFLAASSNDTTAPSIPANVHSTTILDTSIALAWNASTDDVGVTGYKIYRNNSLVGTSATTSFSDQNLSPATTYLYTVKAYDAASNTSAASDQISVDSAFDTTNPSVPTGLTSSAATDTTISLEWNAATDNVAVDGYDVYRNGTLIATTLATTYTDTGLSVHTSYSYKVRSHDTSGNNSAQSSAYDTSTLYDLIDPAKPTGLAASNETTTEITLDWADATDDVAVVGYRIYRNGTFITATSSPTYTDTDLHYNTTYHYTVTAIDAAANESVTSDTLDATTLPDITAPIVSITAPQNGQTLQFTTPITATASDDLDLLRVAFYIDSSLIFVDTAAPFGLNWDSYSVHNGSHTITAQAVDATGNAVTQSFTISVNNPPPPLSGDINGDHKINIFDLSLLLSRWNKSGSGDFNNNGKIDIFDLSVLLARYGQDNSNYH